MGPISGLGREFDKALQLLISGAMGGNKISHTKNSLLKQEYLKDKMLSVMVAKLKFIIDEDGDYTRAEGYREAIGDIKEVFKWAENQNQK